MRVLVIPDIHEDVLWAQGILKKEAGNFDKIIFLGDEFDTRNPKTTAGVENTCQFLIDRKEEFGDKMVSLFANHTMPYAYVVSGGDLKTGGISYYCSGFDPRKIPVMKKILPQTFFSDFKLAHMEDGVLYSHAGATSDLIDGDINKFLEEADWLAKNFVEHEDHRFFRVGWARGGRAFSGGLTWLDWNNEWDDSGHKQIVGHTKGKAPRKQNQSWCVDCSQTFYAIVEDGEKITFKNLLDNIEYSGIF